MQRASSSCSPPHGVAANCATLKGRKSTANNSAPRSAQRGGKTVIDFPARRTVAAQNTAQFSAPCSPTAAPLSLRRCRSARERWEYLLLNVARWDFISILLTAKRVKSLFKRAGDGVSARLGKSCQNTQASFDDFPPKAGRAIWSLPRLELFFLFTKRTKKTFDGC